MRNDRAVLPIVWHALVLAVLAGCNSPTSIPHTESIPGVPGAPFPYAEPEDVGLSSSIIDDLAGQVYGWVRQGRVVGAEVIVVKDRRIVLHEASGWSDRERQIPLARNSIYRLRSMTKPFIGTAVLMLMEEGQLHLDDRVADHLASFDNERSREITIRQLLTHRAGFVQDGYPPGYWAQPTLREAVDLVGAAGPPHPPGSGFRYSDVNSATLGGLAAELTGAPVEHFLEARIFEPLGLVETFYRFTPDVPWASRMNSTYRWNGSSWEKYWDNTMAQEAPFFRASGGLYSTVFDYAGFITAWVDRGHVAEFELLSEATVVEALRSPEGTITWSGYLPNNHYGWHWDLYAEPSSSGQLPAFGHGGSDGTIAVAIPEEDILAFYFTQSRGNDMVLEFISLVLELFRP